MLKQKMKIAGACLGGICLAVAMTGTALAATYTITYDANGEGTFTPENSQTITQTKETGQTIQITDRTPGGWGKGNSTLMPVDPNGGTLVGNGSVTASYTVFTEFEKWTDDKLGKGTVYVAGQNYMEDANLTLYAQWKSTMDKEKSTLPEVIRDGYVLLGWYDTNDDGAFIGNPGDKVELYGVGKLYARWQSENESPSGYTPGDSTSTNPPSGGTSQSNDQSGNGSGNGQSGTGSSTEPGSGGNQNGSGTGNGQSNSGSANDSGTGQNSGSSNTGQNAGNEQTPGEDGQGDVLPNDDIVEVIINADKSAKLTATNTGSVTTVDPTVTIPAKDGAVDVDAIKAQLTAWHVDLTAEKNAEALAALESPDASGTIDFYRDGAVKPASENANENGDVEQGSAGEQPGAASNASGTPIANVGGQAPAKTEKLSATVDVTNVLVSVIAIAAVGAIGAGIIRRR